MRGYFTLVLHTHMPYVRKNGVWPVGEDWLYQAMSETYLPLLGALAQLEGEGVGPCLAVTLTPVLCEQLADPYIQERFAAHLKTMREHTRKDMDDFSYFDDPARKALAEEYYDEYRRKLLAYLAIGSDIIGALSSFETDGMLETIASAATHAFLPALDERSAREQVKIGVESHRRMLGVQPRGFWIPECAYSTGLEDVLSAEGIEYCIVDSSALLGRPNARPYSVGASSVIALVRSERAHANAWDDVTGYPTDGTYLDSTKYYQGSGLHYWRVTGPGVSIESKEVYQPREARIRALDHAGHYLRDIASEIEGAIEDGANDWHDPPLVLAAYDTEFLGHGWKEGIYWLEVTLRSLAAADTIKLSLPSGFLDENAERARADLASTTWGTDRDASTWINPSTDWMWEELRACERRLFALRDSAAGRETTPRERGAVEQAEREVLLLESSDWPYMVAKDRARDYAIERFRTHLERFKTLADALESGKVDGIETALSEIEEADNLFAKLGLGVVSGHGGPKGP
ncbi:MAG TPA: 1,4-alpha-glucan branching protein domain-containing protein [Candidatus Anoxymicrobiaceae bacterium]